MAIAEDTGSGTRQAFRNFVLPVESLDGFRYVSLADGTAERACYLVVAERVKHFFVTSFLPDSYKMETSATNGTIE